MPFYKIMNETDAYRHVIASFALKLAVAELRITEPRVNFIQGTIKPCADLTMQEAVFGLARASGKQIFVRTGLKHRILAKTVFTKSGTPSSISAA